MILSKDFLAQLNRVGLLLLIIFGWYWITSDPKKEAVSPLPHASSMTMQETCTNDRVYTTVNLSIPEIKTVCVLDLSGQGLEKLPGAIGHFSNLRKLDISNNNLTELTAHVGWLRELEEFDASNNKLTELPKQIGWLREVETLNIANNNIASLPAQIGWLREVETFDVQNNQIAELPKELVWLKKMKSFILIGNPVSDNSLSALKSALPDVDFVVK